MISSSRRQQDSALRFLSLLIFVIIYTCSGVELLETYYDVLNVPSNASHSDIKKSYRQLALDYHPDKVHQFNINVTDARRAEVEDIFLRIQLAYEVLRDTERRLQYDLSLSGVHYDIIDDSNTDLLTSGPYSIFLTSIGPKTSYKLHFSVTYPKPLIPDILLSIDVPLRLAMKGLKMRQKYYRKSVCTACAGNGGYNGNFVECDMCSGTGTARIIHSSHDSSDVCVGNPAINGCCGTDDQNQNYHCSHKRHQHSENAERKKEFFTEKMTVLTCPSCRGRGTQSVGKCANCNGTGTKMVETSISVVIPKGFKNGLQLTLGNAGHEHFDGQKGKVIATIKYIIPKDWSISEDISLMLHTKLISLDFFLSNRFFELLTPLGESVRVEMPKLDIQLAHLLFGFNLTVKHHGLLRGEAAAVVLDSDAASDEVNLDVRSVDSHGDGGTVVEETSTRAGDEEAARGDLIVHCDFDWKSITESAFQALLTDAGWQATNPVYRHICKLLSICDGDSVHGTKRSHGADKQDDALQILPQEVTVISSNAKK